jgi:hypothetical protein
MGGPKLPGGVYAIAHNRHATSLEDIASIAKEVKAAGYVPSVHGDDSSDMMGCGFFKLWLTGRFDDMGYPRPEFDADQGALAVRKAGGQIEMHHGKHTEKVVYINLCPHTTIEPDENDQRFVVDAWIGGKFNLDIPKFLIGAAATVEMLGGPKIAKIIVPALTPANIVAALEARGWFAHQISQAEIAPELVPIKSNGILKCVDGRGKFFSYHFSFSTTVFADVYNTNNLFAVSGSDNKRMGGPKLPGGIYAIAHNRHATKLSDITSITKEVAAAGFVPSVHGDDSSDMMGCGFFKLWLTGRFDDMGYPRPQFDADQGARAVKNAGGVIEMHHGKHTEKVVYINLCPNTTIEPKEHDQRFVVDAWIGGKFDLDIPKFLIAAAATVEMLGGPKIAKVIVPRGIHIIEEA